MTISDIVAWLALSASIVSTYFVGKQLLRSDQLKEAEFINDLENFLLQHFNVYKHLLRSARAGDTAPDGFEPEELLGFVGFFERLLPIIENKAVSMAQIDRMFGFRFFLTAHHPFVQSSVLLSPHYADSFTSIFKLHQIWTAFRISRGIRIPFAETDLAVAAGALYARQVAEHDKA